ncbi:LysR family transcriptional regulator [Halomonas sp. MCCC 1A11036]|uniref:LysR family transcriptional regulator n=1 Tax=Billgrantia zhangzhouensis TaxID=2733481 RepID=A0ABS9AJH0_9GAMM|nr:LysR family transcriptional regulator [Halomonas zhangzhouensis]MCE8021861.1 LysR family transcriptional regulator [Halomonas zhangzhouensis]
MKNIPTELLRTFVTIRDLGGFTSAGEFLGRSQPAISLQIKKLESLLDTQIFLRGTSLELTEDGNYLYQAAKDILKINDRVVTRFSGEHVSGRVRLGIPHDLELAFLPKALRNLARTHPNIMVEVDGDISKVIYQRFQKHHYDVCLVMEPEKQQEDRDIRDFRIDQLTWVMNNNNLTEFDIIPLVTYPQGCIYRSMLEGSLEQAGKPYRIAYTSPSLLGIVSAVEEGLGLTAMASSVAPPHLSKAIETECLPNLGSVSIGLYYRERELSLATRHVLDFLHAGLANLTPPPILGRR